MQTAPHNPLKGNHHILSAGEQLNQLSGVAATLRFPLPELEDQELIEEA